MPRARAPKPPPRYEPVILASPRRRRVAALGTLVWIDGFSYDSWVGGLPQVEVAGLAVAEKLLASRVIGPAAIHAALGISVTDILSAEETQQVERLPFDEPTLERAATWGAFLVLRVPRDRLGPLSIRRLFDLFPEFFAKKSMTEGVGYSLRNEWTSSAQPFAAEAPTLGWRLVCAEPVAETMGRTLPQQDAIIDGWASVNGLGRGRLRRRTAVETVYDLVLAWRTLQVKLLERTWDWTRTKTGDGAHVTVGSFDDHGLQILAYSPGVKFQTLGACLEITETA